MKITLSQLKRIITEEIQNVINEGLDPDLILIDNQLKAHSAPADEVLKSMVGGLPYMEAIEVIKMLSEKMPGKFDETLQKLKKS